jgi:hypothetical protein
MKVLTAQKFHAGNAGERRAAGILLQPFHDPFDPMFQERFVEVDQQPGLAVGEPQARSQLLLEVKPLHFAALSASPRTPREMMHDLPGCFGQPLH